ITVMKLPHGITALSKLFEELAKEGILVDMITQTGLVEGRTNISFTVPDEASERALALLRRLVPQLEAEGVVHERDIAKVSAVGIGMRMHTGVAAKMFKVLADEGIEVAMISTAEIKISVLVPRKYCEVAVRALHD